MTRSKLFVFALTLGCAPANNPAGTGEAEEESGIDPTSEGDGDGDPSAGDGDGDGDGEGDGDGDGEMDCGTVQIAPQYVPPNVMIVVDASGSMLDEQKKIGLNLTQFADTITKSNIDVRIVMMTTSSAIPVICPVTPPDPLTGTALAGDPRYKFIESRVDSTNLLDRPVIVSYLLVIVALFILITLVVDVVYSALDPRVRFADASA
jgi:hypothetical protein